ncbi:uncharacterized protein AMSG_01139 [Thecamonas trahens ATCC 50062]|uniref:Nucleotide-diphospho-sugar transferase domain-containing protein n=1 Tax=Thecamonas trahens ATCC 50062 TaxID=461836 RepID=A0A0L0DLM9_THETB|nr:hypothetical protein AMSG_01139 [Thecamonas trahens ATCC 50062]KNC52308.1 hypothetical protein AMSG_01139 [Thecamonas trahens ATCC 50062]|eukprot:XP_013762306.1 hypothetical protein AMSG_01139 [Thecamonas trahens ATCC 50062]
MTVTLTYTLRPRGRASHVHDQAQKARDAKVTALEARIDHLERLASTRSRQHAALATAQLAKHGQEAESWATYLGLDDADVAEIDDRSVPDEVRRSSGSGRKAGEPLRVLIFSWATEDTYTKYETEVYWKACYAATHGYDLIITDELDPKLVAAEAADGDDEYSQEGWYREERMYAWHKALTRHLVSGEYDLVYMIGADTLLVPPMMNFALTRYYEGHPLTIMDQKFQFWGYNQNALLFSTQAAGSWLEAFRAVFFARHKQFTLQSDNGSFMETMLEFLGAEAELNGLPGYDGKCGKLAVLDIPAGKLAKIDFSTYEATMLAYSECFFPELGRLAGPYNERKSSFVNFVAHTDERPWANCWGGLRLNHPDEWRSRCFGIHLNGAGRARL